MSISAQNLINKFNVGLSSKILMDENQHMNHIFV